ncbi:MAG: radical SAM protein, partial [Candidatus Aenigmatarchaeota archaeon]
MIERRIMLVSGECPWNCYFCGYGSQRAKNYSHEEMKKQIDNYFTGFEPGKIDKLKVDIPGSVLDPSQVSRETQKYLVDKCKEYGIQELVVETRPEFVNRKNLSVFEDIDLTVAIGLDVADDHYLRKLRKGFSLSEYETAATIAKANGHKVKTYVLANPPFVDNVKEMLDKTVREALEYSDTVVIINCYPHENTPLVGDIEVEDDEELSEEMKEIKEWEPLEKEEFFDLAKNWLVNPDVEYDLRQGEVPPTWKAWVPRFSEEEKLEGEPEKIFLNSVCSTWQNFLTNRYSPPEGKDTVLYIPDTDTKPRKQSDFYEKLMEFLEEKGVREDVHTVVITP